MKRQLLLLVILSCTVAALLLPTPSESSSHGSRRFACRPISLLPAVFAGNTATEYWHTSGNRILDGHDKPVRISGLNWSGFETTNGVVGGLEAQDYHAILHTIQANGFNAVRIPLSNEMVESPSVPEHIAFTNAHGRINGDLKGKDSMQILDRIVAAAGRAGLKVILDNHRSEAGSSAEESGLWYTDRYPETAWVADWVAVARRYRGNPTVIGVDLRNEPHNAATGGACWDCGGANDWHLAAQRAGDAVLQVNPRLLIFVEGVDEYRGSVSWWGGNLAGVRRSPVRLRVPGRLVYSAHVYGPTEYQQPWFNTQTSPETLDELFRLQWAYISESGIAPVWVGEFGTPNQDQDVQNSTPGSEGQWFSTMIGFLQMHSQIGWTYWGANGEDRYALLDGSYGPHPVNERKALALASITAGALRPGTANERLSPNNVTQRVLDEGSSLGRFVSKPAVSRDDAAITVLPVTKAKAELPAAEITDSGEQRTDMRRQAAAAWRTAPPSVSSPHSGSTAVRLTMERAGSTASDLNEAVSREVRRANLNALRRAELTADK